MVLGLLLVILHYSVFLPCSFGNLELLLIAIFVVNNDILDLLHVILHFLSKCENWMTDFEIYDSDLHTSIILIPIYTYIHIYERRS